LINIFRWSFFLISIFASTVFASPDFKQNLKLNTPQAFSELKKFAEAGNAEALYFMGRIYREGKFNKSVNLMASYNYFVRSANKNFAPAQFEAAVIEYKNKDYKSAHKWFLAASKNGHKLAFHNLAFMYEKGLGVDLNIEKAKFWYKKSSDLNIGRSTRQLGLMRLNGLGYTKDKLKAIETLKTAYKQGDYASAKLLKGLNVEVDCMLNVRTFFMNVPILCSKRPDVRKIVKSKISSNVKEDDAYQHDIYRGKIFSKYNAKIAFGYTADGTLARATALIDNSDSYGLSDIDKSIFNYHKAYIKVKRHPKNTKDQFEYIMSDGIHLYLKKDSNSDKYSIDYQLPSMYRQMKTEYTE